ncbi:L,D-peptidoglycan transpeptidase YkuD, ErfK/YbiS/YcfS/YnhG family [Sporobacter termitidis DSM 10068]|uniref:L,D-peptidoglycan transpeptidase YkuD, ErfK/YbiS/YcfS/YnhG family n=1 Tax=Sporobacter termitidis DSM 10068 TaxID=1123282 RepID=A0A1M5VF18_9FIRM|nr:L,D-transpeptidase family protein [Sporobacter termitidis]SHH73765.1 L,D-peptidoglycan transpeptidase YkuD, ErfK/YbiS/YcfS/YnhG family [Sporobacter termitidis DSM 10068]
MRKLHRRPDPAAPVSRQRLLVTAHGVSATIRCLEKRRGFWHFAAEPGALAGFVGRNGVSGDKREGDGRTPTGLYPLGAAFGVREKPDTRMPYRRITPQSYWVDDPLSPYYNTWVEAPGGGDWRGAEHLLDYPDSYAWAVVVEYNMENIIPGKGSAVFLHCGTRPTSGCIAVDEPGLLRILKWLDPALSPEIMIRPERSGL